MNKKALGALLVIVSIICLIGSIVVFKCGGFVSVSEHRYGGDFYTGSQNATAAAANNVAVLGEILRKIGGFVLLITSLVLFSVGVCCAGGSESTYHHVTKTTQTVVRPVTTSSPRPATSIAKSSTQKTTTSNCQHCGELVINGKCTNCGRTS